MSKKMISWVDITGNTYERNVLMVDGIPFFYNGIQLRVDKVIDIYDFSMKDVKAMFCQARDDGFTVVNTQIRWMDIQPDLFQMAERIDGYQLTLGKSILLSYKIPDNMDENNIYAKVRVYLKNIIGCIVPNLYVMKDGELEKIGTLEVYDPVSAPGFYDFDISEYIRKYGTALTKIDFTLASEPGSEGSAVMASNDNYSPQLIISYENIFDWHYVDELIDIADEIGIKLELLWFGSDNVTVSNDWRIPYYVLRNYQKSVKEDGTYFFDKQDTPLHGIPSAYRFLLCKNDDKLQSKEYEVLKALMDHVAHVSTKLKDHNTVIGCQIVNEPGIGALDLRTQAPHCYCKVCKNKKTGMTDQQFRDQTMWKYCDNLAQAVKESDYPVWTRVNNYAWTDARGVAYNERKRYSEGAALDFIGLDPYSRNITEIYRYGHDSYYAQGSNFSMIMENSGSYENTAQLILASLAGGSVYNLYDLCGPDGDGLYLIQDDKSIVPRGSYINEVRKVNYLLKQIASELATKNPDSLGGTDLVFFNPCSDAESDTTKRVGSALVRYVTSSHSVGIAVNKNDEGILLLSSDNAVFYTGSVARPMNAWQSLVVTVD